MDPDDYTDSEWTASVESEKEPNKLHLSFERRTEKGGHSQMGSNYDYADGYQRKGFGRITGDGRDALRLESIVRQVGDRSEIEE